MPKSSPLDSTPVLQNLPKQNWPLKGPLKLHQPAAACDGDRFRAAENVQLGKDVAQMPFHRGFADEEVRADLLVALAMREQRQHAEFPAGQGFATHACRQLFNKCLRYAGLAAAHFPDTIQEFL